jgi:RecA/RadA recombinase
MIQLADQLKHNTHLLSTNALSLLKAGAAMAVENGTIIAVDGPPGCGKTTAIAALADQWDAGPVHFAKIFPTATDKTVLASVFQAVTGLASPPKMNQKAFQDELRVLLAGTGRLVMLDEAQNAGRDALEMLRILHEDPVSRWGLVLAGVDLRSHISARNRALISRVGLIAPCAKLTWEETPGKLADLHPLYAAMPTDLIDRAHQLDARGELRRWRILLGWLLMLTEDGTKPVTRDILDSALTAMGSLS